MNADYFKILSAFIRVIRGKFFLVAAFDQFREATHLPVFSFLLIQKSQVVLVKASKEFIPANLLERVAA